MKFQSLTRLKIILNPIRFSKKARLQQKKLSKVLSPTSLQWFKTHQGFDKEIVQQNFSLIQWSEQKYVNVKLHVWGISLVPVSSDCRELVLEFKLHLPRSYRFSIKSFQPFTCSASLAMEPIFTLCWKSYATTFLNSNSTTKLEL